MGFTLAGALLGLLQGELEKFLREWSILHGFFLLAIGILLGCMSLSAHLPSILRNLKVDPPSPPRHLASVLRVSITGIGTASLIVLGFPARRLLLYFMWVTCLIICLLASVATIHGLDILRASKTLVRNTPALYIYSPAETPGLRRFAEYSAGFGLIITIGYAFAFLGTLGGTWRAPAELVRSVQAFWPTVYVPLCLTVLALPHARVYRLVRKCKDDVLERLQSDVLAITANTDDLTQAEIERLNALADLIRRIEDTPNYPKNIKIIGSMVLTVLLNLATLLVPKDALAEMARRSLSF